MLLLRSSAFVLRTSQQMLLLRSSALVLNSLMMCHKQGHKQLNSLTLLFSVLSEALLPKCTNFSQCQWTHPCLLTRLVFLKQRRERPLDSAGFMGHRLQQVQDSQYCCVITLSARRGTEVLPCKFNHCASSTTLNMAESDQLLPKGELASISSFIRMYSKYKWEVCSNK